MRINYIKYHNYRCFKDLTVEFKTTKDKNISLVMGVNGSGKTEMLFSFQWVLYGFDFKSMREKEETPYALNSALYHQLEVDRHANSVDCWVELSFTHKGIDYFIKRTETFFRINETIKSNDRVALSYTRYNGERTPEETDRNVVDGLISRIIPKSILEGITFDGERMKKLNVAEQSKDTIKNVISLVTNEKLFELCTAEIKDLKKDIVREKNKINRQTGNISVEELEEQIKEYEDSYDENYIALNGVRHNQSINQTDIETVSEKLSQLDEAHKLEQKRKGLEKDLETANKTFAKDLDLFYKRLVDGYFLITDALVDDVKSSIENVDVPAGLTVEAVRSILKRPRCICGCEMDEKTRRVLTEMISTLPPDNISSTLLYMTNQFAGEKKRAKNLLSEAYDAMLASEDAVVEVKTQLSEISSSLIGNASEQVRELELKRKSLYNREGQLKQSEERCERELERNDKLLKEARKKLNEAYSTSKESFLLNAQTNVLNLFGDAIKKIGERNSELSLESINNYLSKSYSKLSEDTGRRIYLCQHDKREKYSLITYLQKRYDELLTTWINSGMKKTLEDEGLNESEINERIILRVKEGKSTGQSKVNSLSFAKAVLDYSNEDRTNDELKVSHDYPFLIDSPFTELSGKNLENVAEHIHSFASQIILMADDKSYGSVERLVSPSVCSKTQLYKDKIEGVTYKK